MLSTAKKKTKKKKQSRNINVTPGQGSHVTGEIGTLVNFTSVKCLPLFFNLFKHFCQQCFETFKEK